MNVECVKADGISIKYFNFGTTGKPKVVIIPGLSIQSVTNSAALIATQYSILAKDFDIYLIDRNEEAKMGYTMEQMAKDTMFAMDAIGIKDANLLGASQGGMIAQEIAIMDKSYVHSLVLCSTSARVNPKDELITEWVNLAKENKKEELLLSFLKNVYTEDYYNKHNRAMKAFARFVTDADLRRFEIIAKPILGFNVVDKLKGINIPTLVAASKVDKVVPFYCSEELIDVLGAQSLILEDYSHAMYDEYPEFLPKVYEYLKSVN